MFKTKYRIIKRERKDPFGRSIESMIKHGLSTTEIVVQVGLSGVGMWIDTEDNNSWEIDALTSKEQDMYILYRNSGDNHDYAMDKIVETRE